MSHSHTLCQAPLFSWLTLCLMLALEIHNMCIERGCQAPIKSDELCMLLPLICSRSGLDDSIN